MPEAEKQPFENSAKIARLASSASLSPLDTMLENHSHAEVPGGPWNLSASRAGKAAEWPLARDVVCQGLREHRVRDAAVEWEKEHAAIWQEDEAFPSTVDMDPTCYRGECTGSLTPAQWHSFRSLREIMRLLCRHHGLPSGCPLCLEFRSGLDVVYALVGDNNWKQPFDCDLLHLKFERELEREYMFELCTVSDQDVTVDYMWPKIESETGFLLNLVTPLPRPWIIHVLQAASDRMCAFKIEKRTLADPEELREKEAARLIQVKAMKLFQKAVEARQSGLNKPFGRGGRKGKGKGSTKAPSGAGSGCSVCGGPHYARDCPKGKGRKGKGKAR